jgi:hypothetical protein
MKAVKVIKLKDESRASPWMVRHFMNRLPVRSFFKTKEDALQHAQDVRDTLRSGGDACEVIKSQRLVAGTYYKLSDVVSAGLAALNNSDPVATSPTATFGEGIDLVLSNSTHCRKKTLAGYKSCFGPIRKMFGPRIATTITKSEIETYLKGLVDRQGGIGKASPFTKDTVLRHIRMAFRALGNPNPFPGLSVKMPREKAIQFFSNEDVKAMFMAAHPEERGQLALATFAAIRPQTVERMSAECINMSDRSILIPAHLSKDHRAHCLETVPVGNEREVRPGPPPIVWEWLEKYPFRPSPWLPIQRRLRRALKDRWIQDGLRHTGATNYRSKWGDGPTAELLTHASVRLVNEYYAGLTTRAKADEFLNMGPDIIPAAPEPVITQRKKIVWPSDEVLAKRLLERPATVVALELGCSDSMISKRCRLRGIPKLGRGKWTDAKDCIADQNGAQET